jgi:hypothetical protein
VLLGVMSPEWCAAMEGAWAQHFDTGGRAGGEKADPWDEAIMDRLAVENPWSLQITEALMPEPWLQLPYWTNVVTPHQVYKGQWGSPLDKDPETDSSPTQSVHRDQAHFFPEGVSCFHRTRSSRTWPCCATLRMKTAARSCGLERTACSTPITTIWAVATSTPRVESYGVARKAEHPACRRLTATPLLDRSWSET